MKVHNEHVVASVRANAKQLLLERGVKGWSMDELAEMSGLAKKTLYRIAGSREKLIREVVLSDVEQRIAVTVELLTGDEDFDAKLERIPPVVADSVVRYGMRGVISQFKRHHPAIWEDALSLKRRQVEPLHAFFAKGIREGRLRGDLTPQQIVDLALAVVDFYNEHYTGSELGEKLETALAVVVRGIRA